MSFHPFPIFIPMGGNVGGPDIPTKDIVWMSQMKVFCEMSDRLRGFVGRFNASESVKTRKKEIEQLAFWRGIHFPEMGKILHPHRIGVYSRLRKTPLPLQFVVRDDDIVIERLKDSSKIEYEEVKRFPLEMITLDLKLERDKEKLENGREYEFIISVLWKAGSEENASFDSSQL